MTIKDSIEKLIRKCGLCQSPLLPIKIAHPLALFTNDVCPKEGWTHLFEDEISIDDAIERIKVKFGPVRDVASNTAIGSTFLSVFADGKWQRCAIGKFSGVWAASYSSELIEKYEASINKALEREVARR